MERNRVDSFDNFPASSGYSCRMYEASHSRVGDLVMGKVVRLEDGQAYVSLHEFGDVEAMLQFSEVIKVDTERNYIDLSKRHVTKDETENHTAFFNKSKQVHGIVRFLAERIHMHPLCIYERIVWPLYRAHEQAHDAFALMAREGVENVLRGSHVELETLELPKEKIEELLESIVRHRFTATKVTIEADIRVSCFSRDGVEALKHALTQGSEYGRDAERVKVCIVASPEYRFSLQTADQACGLEQVNKALQAIEKAMRVRGGEFQVVKEPHVLQS